MCIVRGFTEDAYHALAQQVSQMTTAEAASLLRLPPKRYNHKRKAEARMPIGAIVRKAHANTAKLRTAAKELNAILAVPTDHQPQKQGSMLCALLQRPPLATSVVTEHVPA